MHQICTSFVLKSANLALNIVLFYALVIKFLTKFVLNSTIRKCNFCIIVLNYDAKLALKFVPNSTKKVHNLHHRREFMKIRCQKGAGTEIHKCYVNKIRKETGAGMNHANLSIYLSIYLTIYLSNYLSIYLASIYLSIPARITK